MSVAAVEIEVSPQSYEQQTKDGKHGRYLSRSPAPRSLSTFMHVHGLSDRYLQRAWDRRRRIFVSTSPLYHRLLLRLPRTARWVVDFSRVRLRAV